MENNIEPLTESKKDILLALVKQIKIGVEIKHMVLPCFLLQPRSTLESFTDTFSCLDELYRVEEFQDKEERFLQFVKFYISGFHTAPRGIKKPFNPVIGEVFDCEWNTNQENCASNASEENSDIEDKTVYVAEQISHHPPISAYCLYNKKREIVCNATIIPQYVKFYGNSCESHLNGILVFHFLKSNEKYEVTLPTLGVKGILIGKLARFLNGNVTIKRVSPDDNYSCNLEFLTKGILGSSKNNNGIKGQVLYNNKPIFKVKGNWDNQIKYTRINPSSNVEEKEKVLFDVQTAKPFTIQTKPTDEQPWNSSYHLWREVTKNILNGDDQATSLEKQKIEMKQRNEEAERQEKGIHWEPERFVLSPYKDYENFYIYKELDKIFPKYFKPQNISN